MPGRSSASMQWAASAGDASPHARRSLCASGAAIPFCVPTAVALHELRVPEADDAPVDKGDDEVPLLVGQGMCAQGRRHRRCLRPDVHPMSGDGLVGASGSPIPGRTAASGSMLLDGILRARGARVTDRREMLLKQVVELIALSCGQPARGPIGPSRPVVDLVFLPGLAPRDFDDLLRQCCRSRIWASCSSGSGQGRYCSSGHRGVRSSDTAVGLQEDHAVPPLRAKPAIRRGRRTPPWWTPLRSIWATSCCTRGSSSHRNLRDGRRSEEELMRKVADCPTGTAVDPQVIDSSSAPAPLSRARLIRPHHPRGAVRGRVGQGRAGDSGDRPGLR